MSINKKVSIVVAVYNTEDLIGYCIDSIRAQTYLNIEVILVDDGSTDHSPEICDKYAKKDGRIKVIHKQNGGLAAARNSGIDIVSGEYVYFVDGDDLIRQQDIEILVDIAEKSGADIVQCGVQSFLDQEKVENKQFSNWAYTINTGREMCRALMFGGYKNATQVVWNKLYRRKIFEHIRFIEGIMYDDVAILHEILWAANRVAVTTLPLALYRSKRKNSITHSGHKAYGDQIKAAKRRCKFFALKNDKELFEQGIYLLCNDYARYRQYNDDKSAVDFIEKDHKKLWRIVRNSDIAIGKKILIFIGMYAPKFWFLLWTLKQQVKTIIEWKGESISIFRA